MNIPASSPRLSTARTPGTFAHEPYRVLNGLVSPSASGASRESCPTDSLSGCEQFHFDIPGGKGPTGIFMALEVARPKELASKGVTGMGVALIWRECRIDFAS